MRNILFILLISLISCVVPQQCCDDHTYYPKVYPQPAKVIVIKKNKPIYKDKPIRVKVNKHRKTIKRK